MDSANKLICKLMVINRQFGCIIASNLEASRAVKKRVESASLADKKRFQARAVSLKLRSSNWDSLLESDPINGATNLLALSFHLLARAKIVHQKMIQESHL